MKNRVIDEKFSAIVDSVCYWLGYQLKIGREQLMHEASLRYPIADSLTSKGVAINRIVLEKLHPLFKSKKIDLVIYESSVKEPETEKDDSKLLEVYEFKIAKSKTGEQHSDEHQRVFDDVVRLAYYHMWGNKECYFLMCGTYENFKAFFVGQQNEIKHQEKKNTVTPKKNKKGVASGPPKTEEWKPKGLYKDWFEFKPGESVEITFDDTNGNWGLSPFKTKYQPRKSGHTFGNEITIKTTCITVTSVGEKNKTHAAGIWEIESV